MPKAVYMEKVASLPPTPVRGSTVGGALTSNAILGAGGQSATDFCPRRHGGKIYGLYLLGLYNKGCGQQMPENKFLD